MGNQIADLLATRITVRENSPRIRNPKDRAATQY